MRPKELPINAATWGYDGDRLVYLERNDLPCPADKKCPCGAVVKDADEWEKHAVTHRVWRYVGEPFKGGLEQHRLCTCGKLYDRLPMWCPDCGGYISLDNLKPERKSWLVANRKTKTDSGISII